MITTKFDQVTHWDAFNSTVTTSQFSKSNMADGHHFKRWIAVFLQHICILNAVRCPYVRTFVRNAGRGQLSSKWRHNENGDCERRGRETREWRHNENDVIMIIAGLWRYGDWRHVATGLPRSSLTDVHKIWHDDAGWPTPLYRPLKFPTFHKSKMADGRHLDNWIIAISLRNRLTDRSEIWYDGPCWHSWPYQPLEFRIFKIQDGRQLPSIKSRNLGSDLNDHYKVWRVHTHCPNELYCATHTLLFLVYLIGDWWKQKLYWSSLIHRPLTDTCTACLLSCL